MKEHNARNLKKNNKKLAEQKKLAILFDQSIYKDFFMNKMKKPPHKHNKEKNIKSIKKVSPNKQIKTQTNSFNNSSSFLKNTKTHPIITINDNKSSGNNTFRKKNNKLNSMDCKKNIPNPYRNIYKDDGGFCKKLSSNIYHNHSVTNNNINIICLSKKDIKNLLGDDYLNKFINKGPDVNKSKFSNGRFKILKNKNPIINYKNIISNTNGNNENNNICKVAEKYGGDFSDNIFMKNGFEWVDKNKTSPNENGMISEKSSESINTNEIKNDTNDKKQLLDIDNCINIFIEGIKTNDKNLDENYKEIINNNYSNDHLYNIDNSKDIIYLKKQPCITFGIKNETNRKFNTIEKGDSIIMSYYPDKSKENKIKNKDAINDYYIISDHIEYIINIKNDFGKDENNEKKNIQDKESNKEKERENDDNDINNETQKLNNYIICSNLNELEYINQKTKEKPNLLDICSNLLEFQILGIKENEKNEIKKENGMKQYNICSIQVEYQIQKINKEETEKSRQYVICSSQIEYLIPKKENINNNFICSNQIELTIKSFRKIPNFIISSNQIEYKIDKLDKPKEEFKNPITNNPIQISKNEKIPTQEIITTIHKPLSKCVTFTEDNSKKLNDIPKNNINPYNNIPVIKEEKKENDDKLPELNSLIKTEPLSNNNNKSVSCDTKEQRANKRFLNFKKRLKKAEEKEEEKGSCSTKKLNKIDIFAKLLQEKLNFDQNNENKQVEQKPEIVVESDVSNLIENRPIMPPKKKKSAKTVFDE